MHHQTRSPWTSTVETSRITVEGATADDDVEVHAGCMDLGNGRTMHVRSMEETRMRTATWWTEVVIVSTDIAAPRGGGVREIRRRRWE